MGLSEMPAMSCEAIVRPFWKQFGRMGWFSLYASKEMQNDREVVMEAVRQNGRALDYASRELQNDREIAIEAVQQNGRGSPICQQGASN